MIPEFLILRRLPEADGCSYNPIYGYTKLRAGCDKIFPVRLFGTFLNRLAGIFMNARSSSVEGHKEISAPKPALTACCALLPQWREWRKT